jgi:NAD(P)-dependent dehydrogenase (short-subunit alcohol dehydrogenase family)
LLRQVVKATQREGGHMAGEGTVIVTGGSRGIGAAACRKLAAAGYAVAVNYTARPDAAEGVVAAIRKSGGRAHAVAGDVAEEAQVTRLFEEAVRELGPLAGLVNNAGIGGPLARLDARDAAEMQRLIAVNVLGTMLCAREAVRRLSTRHGGKGGSIVNISSVAARLGGYAGLCIYGATKGAVETFTRGLANEVAREGIRVNAVAPGMTETDMLPQAMRDAAETGVPMGRVGTPDEIAEAIAFLISPASSYMTGSVVTVSGGR